MLKSHAFPVALVLSGVLALSACGGGVWRVGYEHTHKPT